VAYVIASLLQPAIVNKRINQLKVTDDVLQKAMGIQQDGPNVNITPSRRGSVDVFNKTRIVPNPSTPGAPATVVAPNPVGNYPFQIPRINYSIPLNGEMLSQLRPIGGPVSSVDSSGMSYIADQEKYLKEQVTCYREFQAAAVLRGSYTYSNVGTSEFGGLVHAFTGGSIQINYQIPSGNLSQLNMLGAGNIITATWLTNTTQIVSHLFGINAAFINLTGRGLRDMWCTSVMWNNIQNNTQVQTLAGSANTYYESIERDEETENFIVRLKAIPWVKIHVTDNLLNIGGSNVKLIDDTCVAFTTNLDGVVEAYTCGEPVSEWQGMPSVFRFGEYYWVTPTFNPTGYQLFSLCNVLPVVNIPKAIAYGTCVF
jgi:Phage major capsid protein E